MARWWPWTHLRPHPRYGRTHHLASRYVTSRHVANATLRLFTFGPWDCGQPLTSQPTPSIRALLAHLFTTGLTPLLFILTCAPFLFSLFFFCCPSVVTRILCLALLFAQLFSLAAVSSLLCHSNLKQSLTHSLAHSLAHSRIHSFIFATFRRPHTRAHLTAVSSCKVSLSGCLLVSRVCHLLMCCLKVAILCLILMLISNYALFLRSTLDPRRLFVALSAASINRGAPITSRPSRRPLPA